MESSEASLDAELLEAARSGDAGAFAILSEPHRSLLLTHCYQILGSLQDAEDAVQEALLRAWLHLAGFEERSAFRTWLYRIATNVCLDVLRRHQDIRTDYELHDPDDEELSPDSFSPLPSIEPIPSRMLAFREPDPEAAVLTRESVSIAFMTLLHQLPPRQRVIVILRDVLGWQAREVAEFLGMSDPAVNSALIRARAALQATPDGSRRQASRLPDEGIRALLHRYVEAWQQRNIDQFLALLREDALITMPPFPLWFNGKAAIRDFIHGAVFAQPGTWKLVDTAANGQPALAVYQAAPPFSSFQLVGLQILTVRYRLHSSEESGAADAMAIARIDHYMIGETSFRPEPVEPSWLPYFDLPFRLPV